MSFNKMAVLDDYPKLDKLFKHWTKLHRATRDIWPATTWPALFKTKEHKRRVLRRNQMLIRLQIAVEKELDIQVFSVRRLPDIGFAIMWDTERNES